MLGLIIKIILVIIVIFILYKLISTTVKGLMTGGLDEKTIHESRLFIIAQLIVSKEYIILDPNRPPIEPLNIPEIIINQPFNILQFCEINEASDDYDKVADYVYNSLHTEFRNMNVSEVVEHSKKIIEMSLKSKNKYSFFDYNSKRPSCQRYIMKLQNITDQNIKNDIIDRMHKKNVNSLFLRHAF